MVSPVLQPGSRCVGAAACAALGMVAAILGCASPGVPKPPSLRLPSPATALAGERMGGTVLLTWQTPNNTTDGQANRLPITAVLCREQVSGNPVRTPAQGSGGKTQVRSDTCAEVTRLVVGLGPGSVTDRLPPELTAGPARLLAYRVELFNAAGRSARASATAFAAAGAVPAAAGLIHVIPVRQGVTVQWVPQSGTVNQTGFMELKRVLQTVPRPDAETASAHPTTPGFSFNQRQASDGPVVLRPEGFQESRQDAGGMLDPGVHPGDTATYTAQRVRMVELAGHMLELRGEPSAPVTLTDHGVFPPRTPERLSTVASPALGSNPPEIDLSWAGNEEIDLLGYNVYRSDPGQRSGAFRPLTTEPVAGPAYRDLDVRPGVHYRYRVTALDDAHEESQPSATVEETLPAQTPNQP